MQQVAFFSVDDVLVIHSRVIEEFGGDSGLRDRGLLESAVAMPHSTFNGADLHPGLASKAAASLFHLCANRAFVDGNKRVAVASAEVFLLINGSELSANDDEIEELTLGVVDSQLSKDQVIEFFEKFITKSRPA
jgi:death-on-curing protein